jgi:hypothetical protein
VWKKEEGSRDEEGWRQIEDGRERGRKRRRKR